MDASHTMILAEMGTRGLVPEATVDDVHHICILMLLSVVTATEHKISFFFFFLKFETRSHVAHAFKLTHVVQANPKLPNFLLLPPEC